MRFKKELDMIRFQGDEVNFEVKYEGQKNCTKTHINLFLISYLAHITQLCIKPYGFLVFVYI